MNLRKIGVAVKSLGVVSAVSLIAGCRNFDGMSPYRVTPCDAICGKEVREFDWGKRKKVSATSEMKICLPTDKGLRKFAEANIALNWRNATFADKVKAKGYQDTITCFFADFKENISKEYKESKGAEAPMDWEYSLSAGIEWENGEYLSYRSAITTYFGGAHPDEFYWNGTYSRKLGRRLLVSDLIDGKDMLAVAKLICKTISVNPRRSKLLRECMSKTAAEIEAGKFKSYVEYARPYDGRGDGDIGGNPCVGENFMIVEEGIIWTYNEYEIASYSEGHTDVLVPWKSIMPYLKSKKIEMK